MKLNKTIFYFVIYLISINIVQAQETTQISEPKFYPETSFSELFSNLDNFNEKYISLYGYYDKSSNLFKENPQALDGLLVSSSSECRDYSYGPECKFTEDKWVNIAGFFEAKKEILPSGKIEYKSPFKLKAELIHSGKKIGSSCFYDNECQNHICLLAPDMKMILPNTNFEDLPSSAKIIDLEVQDSRVQTFSTNSVIVLDKGPKDYGFCLGYALAPTPAPDEQRFVEKVKEIYIEKGVIEEDEPFVLGALTQNYDGGTGYAITEWNNNKYMWVLLKPGDEKYLDWIKEAVTEIINEEDFNNKFKLVSINRPSIPSINYIPDRKMLFAEFLVKNNGKEFPVLHKFTTHNLVNGDWIEVNKEDFKKVALEQYEDAVEKSQRKSEVGQAFQSATETFAKKSLDAFGPGVYPSLIIKYILIFVTIIILIISLIIYVRKRKND